MSSGTGTGTTGTSTPQVKGITVEVDKITLRWDSGAFRKARRTRVSAGPSSPGFSRWRSERVRRG
ncbi:hypothetical protein GCM10011574_00730 [Microbispora bryophytorum]|uniref:Uncharacterized protein n=1 Tax=Microbispora bryophytorum TaxID=1460882 RepID=A0A8H9LAU5_9ACTN|nr:hypothetical protein GCM10011574_00730 [Microbispora bryophytorum]